MPEKYVLPTYFQRGDAPLLTDRLSHTPMVCHFHRSHRQLDDVRSRCRPFVLARFRSTAYSDSYAGRAGRSG